MENIYPLLSTLLSLIIDNFWFLLIVILLGFKYPGCGALIASLKLNLPWYIYTVIFIIIYTESNINNERMKKINYLENKIRQIENRLE